MKNWDIVKGMSIPEQGFNWMDDESHALVLWGGYDSDLLDANSLLRKASNQGEDRLAKTVLGEIMIKCEWQPEISEENICKIQNTRQQYVLVIAPRINQSLEGIMELLDLNFQEFMGHGENGGERTKWYLRFSQINEMGEVVGNLKDIVLGDGMVMQKPRRVRRDW